MKKPAKKITLGILVGTWLVGMVGCFLASFDMEKMTSFMLGFSPFFLGLVASIGVNSYKEKQRDNQKSV
jgi:cadmium resistance protein CadD (predicted permease)